MNNQKWIAFRDKIVLLIGFIGWVIIFFEITMSMGLLVVCCLFAYWFLTDSKEKTLLDNVIDNVIKKEKEVID